MLEIIISIEVSTMDTFCFTYGHTCMAVFASINVQTQVKFGLTTSPIGMAHGNSSNLWNPIRLFPINQISCNGVIFYKDLRQARMSPIQKVLNLLAINKASCSTLCAQRVTGNVISSLVLAYFGDTNYLNIINVILCFLSRKSWPVISVVVVSG